MTRTRVMMLITAVCLAMAASGALARSWYDTAPKSNKAQRVQQYQIENYQMVRDNDLETLSGNGSQAEAPRRPLGGTVTSANASPGIRVDNSYEDWQWSYPGHHVEWRGRPYIQFSYIDRPLGAVGVSKHGYNGYNPITGTWPQGIDDGCEMQFAEDVGLYPNIDVKSNGRVVMGGHQTTWTTGAALDNVTWYQGTTPFTCVFAASVIDSSQYRTGMYNYRADSARLYQILIELQEWGNDTITHLIGQTGPLPRTWLGTDSSLGVTTIQYFRRMSFTGSPSVSWIGPVTLDTVQRMSALCASRVSPKVAVVYLQYTPEARASVQFPSGNFDDQAVYYRESDSIGMTWKPKVNITPYNRVTGPSFAPWVEARGLYDSNGKLHIVFNAHPVPTDPYGTEYDDWNSLLTGSSLLHWSDANPSVISRIHNAEWDFDTYPIYSVFCGFVGTNMLTTGAYAISECNGHLYVVWVMGNDINANPPLLNDCISGSGNLRDQRFKANGEIYMSVSSDLDGLLWDKYRCLTNSRTPGCDSSGYGGVCMNDVKPTMSRYGMDITSFDTNGIGVTLIWPGSELVDPTGTYTGNYYTHMFWVEDHWPGSKSIENTGNTPQGNWVSNPQKWARLACVAPVSSPAIDWNPKVFGYAEKQWVKHGRADTAVITVQNDGNTTLNVTTIGMSKTTQPGVDWLDVTASSLTVNAGIGNTSTFSLIINKDGNVNTPNTIVALTGEVYLLSNVAEPRDSVSIKITNFLVADTLVDLKWDTVSTSCTRLIVSNSGDIGRMGRGGVNLDYSVAGGECVNGANIYAYSGGPIVIRKTGTTYKYSSAIHQGDFTTEQAFKPYSLGSGPSTISSPGVYDGYFTGTFVNRDTTVGVRRTYYAPTVGNDTCNFVIQKSVFFGIGGPQTNVTLGEAIDWDIPSLGDTSNDGRVLASKNVVYQRGNDSVPTSTRCIPHYNRYAAIAFLGMYTPAQYVLDSCANDANMFGAYVMMNDTMFKYDTMSNTKEGEHLWNQMGALSGLTASPFQGNDLHMVMTYKHDMASLDTLIAYSVVISVKNGDTSVLKTGIDKAKGWFFDHLRPGCASCCLALSGDGRTGNVDGDPDKGVDISDLSALIDFLYISFTPPPCMLTANTDGDPDNGVDISDLSGLIDFLYISFTPPAPCH